MTRNAELPVGCGYGDISRHVPEGLLYAFGPCQAPLFHVSAACLDDVALVGLFSSEDAGVSLQPYVPQDEGQQRLDALSVSRGCSGDDPFGAARRRGLAAPSSRI